MKAMIDINDVISKLLNKRNIEDFLLALGLLGLGYIANKIYLLFVAGKRSRKIRILNRDRIKAGYKKWKIARMAIFSLLCIPGIIQRNIMLITIPFIAIISVNIFDIITEKDYEYAVEYTNGIVYRGRYFAWSKAKKLHENDKYIEYRIKNYELVIYKDVNSQY
jgi:hypothetical protein